MNGGDERPPGIFTENQREYLRGEKDIEPGSSHEIDTEKRIMKALKNALLDFGLLNRYMERGDLVELIEQDDDLRTSQEEVNLDQGNIGTESIEVSPVHPAVEEAFLELCVFIYRVYGNMGPFREIVEASVAEIFERHRSEAILEEVELRVQAKLRTNLVDFAEARMENGESLTPAMVTALLQSQEHADEEVGEYVRTLADEGDHMQG